MDGRQHVKKLPNRTVCSWPKADYPSQRIYMDYAGPADVYMFLVIVDSFSNWLEVKVMKSTTTYNTIRSLRGIFSRNRLPQVVLTATSHSLYQKNSMIL
ncbi:K02A2.6-like [Cordylochernes scorpioides]|uniref:K02A2.6-like n=1 Tax=Cordylochernes scorpioides TaxID=51811 RepID=A0ABY6LNG4_9ARAC|nr:K02A2.6-like [Cordylochernes scorpioides]